MTVIYLTEYNCKCYGVTFENDGCVKVQKIKDISNYETNILRVKPLKTFLGKSECCRMTEMSGAFDKTEFDGNNILLKISEENGKKRYMYIGGDMICSFLTNDNIYKYISNMGNNSSSWSVAIGADNIYFLTSHSKFIKREKINDNELLKTKESSVDPFDYHVSNCGKNSFKKLRKYKIHSNYDQFT